LGVGSDAGKALVKALNDLAKQVPSGAVSPGIQQSTMERLLQQQKQAGPQIAAMRAAQPGQQPGAGVPPAAA
jgi:hypothetical protein